METTADGLDGLLDGVTERAALGADHGKSGATLERLIIGGQPYVLKHLNLRDDWAMRASGCLHGPPLALWRTGVLGRLPDVSVRVTRYFQRKDQQALFFMGVASADPASHRFTSGARSQISQQARPGSRWLAGDAVNATTV